MKVFAPRWFLVLWVLAVGGCQDKPSPSATTPADVEADIRVNLARLGPEDQQLAEQQKYCPMMEGVRLGEMGRPHKIEVQGESVYVCCHNCVRQAQENPKMARTQIQEFRKARARALPGGAAPATAQGVEETIRAR